MHISQCGTADATSCRTYIYVNYKVQNRRGKKKFDKRHFANYVLIQCPLLVLLSQSESVVFTISQ